jgi:hypothetical protein
MSKSKIQNQLLWVAILVVGLLTVGGIAYSYGGSTQNLTENGDINVYNSVSPSLSGETLLGAAVASEASHLSQEPKPTAFGSSYFSGNVEIDGTTYLDGSVDVDGAINIGGGFTYLEGYDLTHKTTTTTATTTLVAADSGTTYYVTSVSSTNFVLPATSTAAGAIYRFVIDGALTGDAHVYTADYSNIIEGSMIVAGAVVDCDAEDTITFVSDGENIGDFIELRSNGVNWLIGASGALTSSKMTCSTST